MIASSTGCNSTSSYSKHLACTLLEKWLSTLSFLHWGGLKLLEFLTKFVQYLLLYCGPHFVQQRHHIPHSSLSSRMRFFSLSLVAATLSLTIFHSCHRCRFHFICCVACFICGCMSNSPWERTGTAGALETELGLGISSSATDCLSLLGTETCRGSSAAICSSHWGTWRESSSAICCSHWGTCRGTSSAICSSHLGTCGGLSMSICFCSLHLETWESLAPDLQKPKI